MGLFDSVAGLFKPGAAFGSGEAVVVGRLVEAVDPQLRSVPSYQDRLLPVIEHAAAYCDRLVAAIPGPIDVSSQTYPSDPRVQAIFPAVEEIPISLGRSLALRDGLRRLGDKADGSAFALLGMRRRRGMDGSAPGEARNGNGNSAVPFADHTFRSIGLQQAETRKYLAEAAFDGLVIGFTSRWTELCRRQVRAGSEQRVETELARAQPQAGGEASIHEQHMMEAALQPTPAHMLDALVEWLQFPEEQLRLDGSMQAADLTMPILIGRDRRHWPVCLTRISLSETAEAIARETRVHRYILI